MGIKALGIELWLWFCAFLITAGIIGFVLMAARGFLSYFTN